MDEGPSLHTLVARVEWIRELVADGCGLESELHRDLCAALASGDAHTLMRALLRWIRIPDSERLAIFDRAASARESPQRCSGLR
jgi:hypothetical protein